MKSVIRTSVIAARQFATAASHAPPKKQYGINGRYAGATYTAASKVNMNHKNSLNEYNFLDIS